MHYLSSSALRQDLSRRNVERARRYEHEATYGSVPSVIYREEQGRHGNFFPASYRSICARPEWHTRLGKSYAGGTWVARSWERNRCELDCANSSDALLMNIFCCPKVLERADLCGLLGVESGLQPEFGFKPRIPLLNGRADRTEVDMCVGDILVEAKLTETCFQSAPSRLLFRYRDLSEVFDVDELSIADDKVHGYQLIRGVLAAYAMGYRFLLLCDGRRADLTESWFEVLRAVRSYTFRSRLKLLTWQETGQTLPKGLRNFLEEKYGIYPNR
jgi:hypothetical protein